MNQPIFNNIFSLQARANGASRGWFSFAHSAENRVAEISIDDEIGGWGISARRLVDQIKSLGEKDVIKVHIFSPGGDVLEANEIYNALVDHQGEVQIEIGALCASAATIIACAGDTISMRANGLFMIHNPWTMGYGDADEFRKVAAVLDKFKNNIVSTYKERTGKAEADLTKFMDDESWFTAAEALEHKFIDKVDETEEEEEEDSVQDKWDFSRFRNFQKAFSRLPEPKPRREQTSAKGGNAQSQKPAPGKPKNKNKPNKLLTSYMTGKISIFNGAPSPLAQEIASRLTPHNRVLHKKTRKVLSLAFPYKVKNALPPVEPEVEEEDTPEVSAKIKAAARKLLQAKLSRDGEIDDIVVAVRKRDKRDFAALASKFKKEDKSPDDFARAILSSEEFTEFKDPVGSGIEVVGVQGLPVGTPGELFVSSEEYKALILSHGKGKAKTANNLSVETRGFIAEAMARFMNTTSSTGLTSIEKLPGVVTLGVRPLMVKDLIAPGATNNTTIRYIQEQSFTNYADMVAEGAAKPAAAFSLVEVDASVRKIAAYTKVTDELFMDYLAVASYINMRLPYMVERTEEDQLLNGDGTGQNLLGILNQPGIQTQAKGADTKIDAIYRAFTKVRWGNLAGTAQGGFEPDGTIIHPTDWEAIRLAKDGANQYYGGGPFTGAYGNGSVMQFEMLWGKPVVITPAIAQGTALVGAFRLGAQYFQRQGLTIQSTNTDQDDFIKNLTTIRAELRLALAVYRPLCFTQVTGL